MTCRDILAFRGCDRTTTTSENLAAIKHLKSCPECMRMLMDHYERLPIFGKIEASIEGDRMYYEGLAAKATDPEIVA